MSVIISDELLGQVNITEREFLIELAVFLYDKGRLSFGKAKRFAGLNHIQFQKELAKRGVYLNYDVEEFYKDLETLGISKNDNSK